MQETFTGVIAFRIERILGVGLLLGVGGNHYRKSPEYLIRYLPERPLPKQLLNGDMKAAIFSNRGMEGPEEVDYLGAAAVGGAAGLFNTSCLTSILADLRISAR